MAKAYRVAKSPVHGKGLFATKKIAGGELLGYCKTRKTKEAGLHTLTLEDGRLFDVTCSLKYINHSKKPNVSYYDDFSVVALRNIKPGDELLHDYGDEWE
ncbi:SET domain [Spongiibacter sp. IMCC21906]|uniref:SET domain-containing protein n=1 Tax=Spongiibacter sp. IMCC21906 TaxID=1620392 RepID=UPI00062DFBC4|nr:SET domain-containing protein [Spongiibacter sp. IMCC21906]AKH68444.1 SET domain [Spongiibacter sp. IMCC21906]